MEKTLINSNGVVENVIMADDSFSAPEGFTLGPQGGRIGDTWNGSNYVPLPPPPPTKLDVDAERDRRIDAGFSVDLGNGVTKEFQSDEKSRDFIMDLGNSSFAASLDPKNVSGDLRWFDPNLDFKFIASDNSEIPMDADTAYAFTEAFKYYKSAVAMAARTLKNGTIPEDYAHDQHWPSSDLKIG